MKKVLIFVVLAVGVFSYARCPSPHIICEDDESYSIAETERRPYGRHNWMEMQHKYPDFASSSGCERCGEEEYQKTEDRQIEFVH